MTRLSNHALQSEKKLLYPSWNVHLLLHYPIVHLFPSHQAFPLTQPSLLLLFFRFDLKNSLELAYAAYNMQHVLQCIMSLQKKHQFLWAFNRTTLEKKIVIWACELCCCIECNWSCVMSTCVFLWIHLFSKSSPNT